MAHSLSHSSIHSFIHSLINLLTVSLYISGFAHSAFTFAHESLVSKSTVSQSDVPPGALITFLQKGLEYVGIEEHIEEVSEALAIVIYPVSLSQCVCVSLYVWCLQDGTVKDFDANYSLLSPFICQAVGVKEEKRIDKTKSQLAAEKASKEAAAAGKVDVANGDAPPVANCFAVAKHENQVKSVTLQGHQGEVFICLWNPVTRQLASGYECA